MVKLLSSMVLFLTIVLFPPAVLAVISQNAVPGDKTYPIKRTLEQGILAVASLNPYTKAMFSVNRSQTRFKESQVLIAAGKNEAGSTLKELVEQTAVAAQQIQQVADPIQKTQLKSQLITSIQQYNQGLAQIQNNQTSQSVVAPITPRLVPTPVAPPASPVSGNATPAPRLQPTSLPNPTPTPMPTPVPTPIATSINGSISDDLTKTQDELKKIEDSLKNSQNDSDVDKHGKKEDKEERGSKKSDIGNKFDDR